MYVGPGGHLAEYLVEHGHLTPGDVGRVLEIQRQDHNKRFVDILVEAGMVSPETIHAVFPKMGLPEPAADRHGAHFIDTYVHERFAADDVIFKKGELGLKAYVLLAGSVRIIHPGTDAYLLGIVKPGELFGEMALLAEGHRSATAEAAEACEVMVLARADFMTQLRSKPDVALEVIGLLARRLRAADDLIAMLSDGVPDLS